MFLLYIVYIVFMYFNQPVGNYFVHKVNEWKDTHACCRSISEIHAQRKQQDLADERSRLLGDKNTQVSRQLTESQRSDRSDRSVQQQLAQGGLKRERKSSRVSSKCKI